MRSHTVLGAQTLETALEAFPHAKFLEIARDIAVSHHERFDGSGYPRGLVGDAIPLAGRIVSVADTYDALTSARVYKRASTHDMTRSMILQGSGSDFDPEVVAGFSHCEAQFLAIRQQFTDADVEAAAA